MRIPWYRVTLKRGVCCACRRMNMLEESRNKERNKANTSASIRVHPPFSLPPRPFFSPSLPLSLSPSLPLSRTCGSPMRISSRLILSSVRLATAVSAVAASLVSITVSIHTLSAPARLRASAWLSLSSLSELLSRRLGRRSEVRRSRTCEAGGACASVLPPLSGFLSLRMRRCARSEYTLRRIELVPETRTSDTAT